ncbi:hypothetical protein CDAR_490871 [Caerostris darwini]|uniref:Uncharacterized protein n=1 Tax=Caerostris darwini TaxID=1538125 RepID=A0AAV4NMC4_9ARAC|nr:hypothetical protein CDAR_490871 [Caerostris darwini]
MASFVNNTKSLRKSNPHVWESAIPLLREAPKRDSNSRTNRSRHQFSDYPLPTTRVDRFSCKAPYIPKIVLTEQTTSRFRTYFWLCVIWTRRHWATDLLLQLSELYFENPKYFNAC